MRIFSFLFLLAMTGCECFAQSYIYKPFVEDGKVWHMEYNNEEAPENPVYDFSYFIQGDTIIEGIECKKFYIFNENNTDETRYLMALFENSQKVFFIPNNMEESYILYDFSIASCDIASLNDAIHPDREFTMVNLEESFLNIEGESRRCIRVKKEEGTSVYGEEISSGWWIEGIGSELGPLNTWLFGAMGNNVYLKNCSLHGKEIFRISDLKDLTNDIRPISHEERNSHEGYTNISGIKGRQGMRIYIKNGKKVLLPVYP